MDTAQLTAPIDPVGGTRELAYRDEDEFDAGVNAMMILRVSTGSSPNAKSFRITRASEFRS
jgi:hypothetical protein